MIGVDFGTTFSSISWFAYSTDEERAGVRASDIEAIKNWPEDSVNNERSEQVSTVIWYSSEPIVKAGFMNECPVEWELAIPTIWSPMSSDVMKVAIEDAIRITSFGKRGAPIGLSTGTEPEFAATWVLEKCTVPLDGKTTTILDNGVNYILHTINTIPSNRFCALISILTPSGIKGGTCDAATFRISKRDVLKLEERMCVPEDCACGGSYANKNCWNLIADRLRSESYLGSNGGSLASLVDGLMPDFESKHKRRFDMVKNLPTPAHGISITGLRGDRQMGRTGNDLKRFEDNKLMMDSSDYRVIFVPLLNDMWGVLRGQLDAVKEQGELVQNVVLVGGFSAASSVRSFLRLNLDGYSEDHARIETRDALKDQYDRRSGPMVRYNIVLRKFSIRVIMANSVMAVASGGVLRGLHKEVGPARQAQLSYGLLRAEPFQSMRFPSHKRGRPIPDPREGPDGESYIYVINYFIVKGKVVEPFHRYPLGYPITHTIDLQELDAWPHFCEEVIYFSDRPAASNYPLTCERNMDAQEVHRVLVNMTFLREEFKQKWVQGQHYCEVKFDLLLWVEGKILHYEVRYPAVNASQDPFEGEGEVKAKGKICLTAAIRPSTA